MSVNKKHAGLFLLKPLKQYQFLCSTVSGFLDVPNFAGRIGKYVALACFLFSSKTLSAQAPVALHYENPISNARYPEMVYWFVTPETLLSERPLKDIDHIVQDTKFDFAFLTARKGVRFSDTSAHQGVAEIVKDAHEKKIHVGVTFLLGSVGTTKSDPNDEQTEIADAESTLDADGSGTVQTKVEVRGAKASRTELLRAYVFRKTGADSYDPSTLRDVTDDAKGVSQEPGVLSASLHLGKVYAGYTAVVLSTSWYPSFDLFSPSFKIWMRNLIDQYKDIPLDGTAMDEFGYMRIPNKPTAPWRGHLAGKSFAERFQQQTGMELTRTIFDSRYSPQDHPEVRIRAINEYWDFLRSGPLEDERYFYNYSREVFGRDTLAGIHNTSHNHLTNDEPWVTGINWWTIPRQYGMSDEDLSLPLRMGLLVAEPGNVMYDQFYGWDIQRFASKAMNDARFGARLHYHGYNDTGAWGVDLAGAPFLSVINPVEQKIRLLNRFDPAAPALPLLVVFGMPALLNWYPNLDARNNFDTNGALHIEEKARAIWNAGYRCAVVPSDLIDSGSLKLDEQNRPVLNGHTFRAVIFLYPQYAKPSTLGFLQEYAQHGGALMLEGTATRDFYGGSITDTFNSTWSRARVRGFDVDRIGELGVSKSALNETGGELEDGSIVLTDLQSLQTDHPRVFSVDVNGHRFQGAYEGTFAIRVATNGTIAKLACGKCQTLSRDGKKILSLRNPADLVLKRNPDGKYDAVIEGKPGSNAFVLLQPTP